MISNTDSTLLIYSTEHIRVKVYKSQYGGKTAPAGRGRNGPATYSNAGRVQVRHARLASGDQCPDCERGRVYLQHDPSVLVRIMTELQRHVAELKSKAADWMPWNYRDTLQRAEVCVDSG